MLRRAVASLPFSSLAAAHAQLLSAHDEDASGESVASRVRFTVPLGVAELLKSCWAGPPALRAGAARLLHESCYCQVCTGGVWVWRTQLVSTRNKSMQWELRVAWLGQHVGLVRSAL